jgi:hypothetical protein
MTPLSGLGFRLIGATSWVWDYGASSRENYWAGIKPSLGTGCELRQGFTGF